MLTQLFHSPLVAKAESDSKEGRDWLERRETKKPEEAEGNHCIHYR